MIEYIKEYGVTNLDYVNITNNLREDLVELFILSENNVRKIMEYYNSMGIKEDISKIILSRPDLLLIDEKIIKEILDKTDKKLFKSIIKNNIDDLILIGV